MIYIGNAETAGQGIYLDLHATERDGRGVRFSGTVGDGCYEGEVLIDFSRHGEVLLADEWLGGSEVRAFLERCGGDRLRVALIAATRELAEQVPGRCPRSGRDEPHPNRTGDRRRPRVGEEPAAYGACC